MPKSAPREDLLSVEEAADRLDVSERNVWYLIKSGRLPKEEIGGNTWISSTEITRYLLIYKDAHIDHAYSPFPSPAAPGFRKYVVFGPWGEAGGCYQQFELEVTLDDWSRLAGKRATDKIKYEAIRAEVSGRLGKQAPEYFEVCFRINQDDLGNTVNEVVNSVDAPELPLHGEDDLRSMAMKHLLEHTILRLGNVRGDIRDYLRRAVENFYTDLERRAHPEIAFGGPDEIEGQLISAAHRLSGRKRKKDSAD